MYENEYEERETTECVTKWVPECKTVYEEQCRPTTKKVVSYYDDFISDRSCLKPTFVFQCEKLQMWQCGTHRCQ